MQISKKQLEADELLTRLLDLYDDHVVLDEVIKEATSDRDNLKDEIKSMIALLQPTDERVEILLEDEGKKGWDRQVKHKGGGLDLGLLEAALGQMDYRESCCQQVTTYEFDEDKFNYAMAKGWITEEMVKDCTVKPTLIPSLTRR